MNISARLVIESAATKADVTPFSWLTLLPALVAGVIVIIGWQVVERYSRDRERRADLRAGVNSFRNAVTEVASEAAAFYQLSGDDTQARSLAESIRIKIGSLSEQILLLNSAGLKVDANELLKRFRQTVTGGSFDEASRQPLMSNSPVLARLNADAQSLAREVEQELLRHLLNVKARS